MAWIQTIEPENAGDLLGRIYAQVRDPASGQLDDIMRVHSLHPGGLAAHFQLYVTVMRGTPTLARVDRELIALLVSKRNGCHY